MQAPPARLPTLYARGGAVSNRHWFWSLVTTGLVFCLAGDRMNPVDTHADSVRPPEVRAFDDAYAHLQHAG